MIDRTRLTFLSIWLGVMCYFSFVVAPSAFSVLPSPVFAGSVVSRTLGIAELIGIILGLILIALYAFSKDVRGKSYWFESLLIAAMTLSMIVSRFVVSKLLHTMRVEHGEISALPAGDSIRIAFDRLHQYSVWLMGFDMLVALILIVVIIRRGDPKKANA